MRSLGKNSEIVFFGFFRQDFAFLLLDAGFPRLGGQDALLILDHQTLAHYFDFLFGLFLKIHFLQVQIPNLFVVYPLSLFQERFYVECIDGILGVDAHVP